MEAYVGQIIAVGFNFPPVGWLLCNGQTVPIAQYEALYALIGTTYGGDGQTTFGVPNLCGRSPLGQGTGLGLPTYVLGQMGGTETVTLTSTQIAVHGHPLLASSGTGSTGTPASNTALATLSTSPSVTIYGPPAGSLTLAPSAIGLTGGNLPHENRQPFNTVNYIISAYGVYPSQG